MRQTNAHHWYAFYTSPRAEKQVHKRIVGKGYECYLPLQRQLRQWSDRKKWVEVPLISSHLFVKIPTHKVLDVLQISGVSRYIGFEGKPAPIPDEQIVWLKKLLMTDNDIEVSTENIAIGDKVVVKAGQLLGITGELVDYKGSKKVIVRLENLGYSLLITLNIDLLSKYDSGI